MEEDHDPSPSPTPFRSPPNSIFKDISNFKTPKQNPNFSSPYPQFKTPKPFNSPIPQFFTATKQTPSSSFRRRTSTLLPSSSRSKATRTRLKAFELEQSQSSRKTQIRKEKSLKSLSKALTVWLNFLFESPKACGCQASVQDGVEEPRNVLGNGKRDSWPGRGVEIDGPWRSPKRQRDSSWRPEGFADAEPLVLSSSAFASLKVSLQDVCSFDDLAQRLRGYLSADGCKEVFSVMSKVTKNIDEGRLKMRAHCPIVTDVRLKEKAIRVLMCYNPMWLRIGMYVVFGGDSLLPTGDVYSEQEVSFLKMIAEKLLFTHGDLAKSFAYNKSVGLYRPGYFEALGNVILKRFLLLVLILDIAKSQSSLPIKYGIDGTDGGSPLLFGRQSNIKSSREIIQDFLTSEVMHGEGDLLAHLVIVGYKASYQQYPLLDYDFKVNDLFDDLQDGVRLCRAIQLLTSNTSILMKLVVPSDTHKRNLVNCGSALQYLKQAGVGLSDEDGVMIVSDDVACGEKELTLSLLWNTFVHLQLPLLVNKLLLFEEICKVNGTDVDRSMCNSSDLLEMILEWTQAICLKYDLEIANYAALVDGKAIWCLIDYYFRHELQCSSLCKTSQIADCGDSNSWASDCSDAVHNFIFSQKLTTMLGSFPEDLETSDILEHKGACNERSVLILLVFLSSQLIGRKNMDHVNIHKLLGCNCTSPEVKRMSSHKCFLSSEAPVKDDGLNEYNTEESVRKFKLIQAWWRDMAKQHHKCEIKQTNPTQCSLTNKHGSEISRESASRRIQSHYRRFTARRKFMKIKTATSFLQMTVRAWLTVKMSQISNVFDVPISIQFSLESKEHPDVFGRQLMYMVERHSFVKLRKSALLIQRVARSWIAQRQHMASQLRKLELIYREKNARKVRIMAIITLVVSCTRWKNSIIRKRIAATKIQKHWRAWFTRRSFLHQKKAVIMIQSALRSFISWRHFQQYRSATSSAVIIQSRFRGMICRREAIREKHLIVLIQSRWRGCLIRKDYHHQKAAAVALQSAFRGLKCRKEFQAHRLAAINIQRCARGHISRKKLLGASFYSASGCVGAIELRVFVYCVSKLQRWWRRVLSLKLKTKSTIIIQSHIRTWLAKRKASREKHRITIIQAYWKGYITRKESREQLLDLRLRLQKSCSNVDDGMRLINRLVTALSELLNMKSIRSILHTCSTLDTATMHSQRCCETLVAAGAVETLLKQIRSVSRSVPDQEVLKHALCTLRNISRYPHLAEVLIDTKGSMETVLKEMLRNKGEGYYIACELLRKLCSSKKGVDAVRSLPLLVKRLHSQIEELNRKTAAEKRKGRVVVPINEKRLGVAVDLLNLIINQRGG